jgi:hypothetical protein
MPLGMGLSFLDWGWAYFGMFGEVPSFLDIRSRWFKSYRRNGLGLLALGMNLSRSFWRSIKVLGHGVRPLELSMPS